MAGGTYSRALLTFAFVRKEFDRTGDIIRGLMPLFEPIFAEMDGEIFSPNTFASRVEHLYGLKMHPFVAEDWVPRFQEAGLLVQVNGDQYSKSYRCKGVALKLALPDAADVEAIVAELTVYAEERMRESGSDLSRGDIEAGIVKRLYKPEFLALLSRPQKTFNKSSTLSLSWEKIDDTAIDPESLLDFILADRLFTLSQENRAQFDAITNVAGGALVSEVVLGLRKPPSRGQTAKGVEIYIDSPLILDLMDVSSHQDHQYAKLLIDDLKEMGVYLRTFDHNVDEIKVILDSALNFRDNVRVATGEVANRLRTDSFAISRVQMIRTNIVNHLLSLNVKVSNMETVTANKVKFFPNDRILDLTSQIRRYGSISSREVDAKSIAGVSRMILGRNQVSNIFSLPAIFLTKNTALAAVALQYIRDGYNYGEAAPPFITDRQMAGLVWLARGGEAGNVSARQLLANCTRAIAPRRDVLTRVYDFLAEVNENAAKDFEAMMVEDRCSHYVMSYTLGDAALVTKDNAHIIFEQVKRRAIADTIEKSDAETRRLLDERKRETDIILQTETKQRDVEIIKLAVRSEEQKLTLDRQSTELLRSQERIIEMERATITASYDAACTFVIRAKIVISIGISTLVAIISTLGGYMTGIVTDPLWLLAIILVATGIFTSVMTWVLPDIIFGNMLTRKAEERYRSEIKRRGASSYASMWSVNFSKLDQPPERKAFDH